MALDHRGVKLTSFNQDFVLIFEQMHFSEMLFETAIIN
jgi:hypothetical protein